jgi:gamma-glutamyltranspeptidase
MQQPPTGRPSPSVRNGRRWAVATGHPAGTVAAMRVLENGGSVVDAAIAASAVLTVAMPHATTIGGDAFILMRNAGTGQVTGLNASGCAPRGIDRYDFEGGLPLHGALAAVVPGLVRGWEAMHARHGVHAWKALFADAVELAGAGCPVSKPLAETIAERQDVLRKDPGCGALFCPDGRLLAENETLHQPALAATLQQIAGAGADALFRGEVASSLIQGIEKAGGAIALDDLADFEPEWVEPVTAQFRGSEVHAMPPNSLGVLMLMQLQTLGRLPPAELQGSAARAAAWQVKAMRAAFDVGMHLIGDPRRMMVAGPALLHDPYRGEVFRKMMAGAVDGAPVAGAGTACVTVADREGNAACIVQSIFNPFGSHFLEPRTGILLNNRLSGFSAKPGSPNSIAPGQRCAHTLNPVIVTRNGSLHLVHASPGGASQTVTATQVLTNALDRGMPLGEAIAAPRWAVDRRGTVLFEPEWTPQDVEFLRSRGVEFRQEANAYFFGSATVIEAQANGTLVAAADARRHAMALAL